MLAALTVQAAQRPVVVLRRTDRRHAAQRAGRWALPAQATASKNVEREGHWQQAELPAVPSAHVLPPAPAPDLAHPAPHAPHDDRLTSNAPVLMGVSVPECSLPAGEVLRLVGSCPELGGWDPAAALPLTCAPARGGWAGEVSLPPGQHNCKLVIVRQSDGRVFWEDGEDRTLRVPHLGALCPSSGPALAATCRWGDTAGTVLRVSPAVDQGRLKAAALAAAERAAELAERREMLAVRLEGLVHEMEDSEARIASRRGELQAMVSAELGSQQQQGLVEAQVARLQGEQHAQHAAAALPAQPAHVLPTGHAQHHPGQQQQPPAEGVPGMQDPPYHVSHVVHLVASAHDGCMHFSFAADHASGGGASGTPAAPSAYELARQRLLHLLPAEAQAQLERQGTSEHATDHAAHHARGAMGGQGVAEGAAGGAPPLLHHLRH